MKTDLINLYTGKYIFTSVHLISEERTETAKKCYHLRTEMSGPDALF